MSAWNRNFQEVKSDWPLLNPKARNSAFPTCKLFFVHPQGVSLFRLADRVLHGNLVTHFCN
jgi:hypothetical protein